VPCSSAFLTFDRTPIIERRWRLRQAAAWASGWDGPGRIGEMAQHVLGFVAMLAIPPPPGTHVWPLVSIFAAAPINFLLLALLRWMDRWRYLRHRTAIILGMRAYCFAIAVVVNRHVSFNESLFVSQQRKARIFHVCVLPGAVAVHAQALQALCRAWAPGQRATRARALKSAAPVSPCRAPPRPCFI